MSLPARGLIRRRGFTIVELLVALVLIAILATGASVKMVSTTARIKQLAEAEKLVATLRWLRHCAHTRAPRWQTGYGVFFWNNKRSFSCVQYSPYTAVNPLAPDARQNTINDPLLPGSPEAPATIGPPQSRQFRQDFANLPWDVPASMVTNGYDIVFQTDVPGQADLRPVSYPVFPATAAGYNVDRIVFWPPGYRAPAVAGPAWPQEYGVTLPRRGAITFNRIYIRHPSDHPFRYAPDGRVATRGQQPARIHIHPGTGMVRLMEPHEP